MAMSPRLLRPRASGATHPEAASWAAAVVTNGGTVGSSTLAAVSKFCRDIDAAGIRDRFVRLSLFCGTGLSACLVPLYRGFSRTGTQYGNTTDTNNNFVSGDYAETGASGGLTGNGSSKYLLCGSILPQVDRASSHMMVYGSSLTSPSTGDRIAIGAEGASAAGITLIQNRDSGNQSLSRYFSANNNTGGPWVEGATAGFGFADGCLVGTAVSATDLRMFRNGSQVGSTRTIDRGTGAQTSTILPVFAFSANGSIAAYSAARLRGYSVGIGMTAAQVSAYYTAMQTFQTALTRNV